MKVIKVNELDYILVQSIHSFSSYTARRFDYEDIRKF